MPALPTSIHLAWPPLALRCRRAVVLACATALGAAALAAAGSASAGGDIVRCIGADGSVTLTDSPCESGVGAVIVPAALNGAARAAAVGEAAGTAVKPEVRRASVVAAPWQHDNWVDPHPQSKMLARDAATLRAARNSLQALDEAATAVRQQRMASN